jgi:hypothetical protein
MSAEVEFAPTAVHDVAEVQNTAFSSPPSVVLRFCSDQVITFPVATTGCEGTTPSSFPTATQTVADVQETELRTASP